MSGAGRRFDPDGLSEIRWPAGVTPRAADVFVRGEILIEARTSAIWRHLVEAARWPAWCPDAIEVRVLSGPGDLLGLGRAFMLRTVVAPIDAMVDEFVPYSRLGWAGHGPAMHAHRRWVLRTVGDGCHVVTEEFANGPGAVPAGHDLWLIPLKRLSERRSGLRPRARRRDFPTARRW